MKVENTLLKIYECEFMYVNSFDKFQWEKTESPQESADDLIICMCVWFTEK